MHFNAVSYQEFLAFRKYSRRFLAQPSAQCGNFPHVFSHWGTFKYMILHVYPAAVWEN